MDRGARWATVHRIAKSWTRLKRLCTHTCTSLGPVLIPRARREAAESPVPKTWFHSPSPTQGLLCPHPASPHPSQKLFVVPADDAQARIPYARVNHNKYMVTERATYIGKCSRSTMIGGQGGGVGNGRGSRWRHGP